MHQHRESCSLVSRRRGGATSLAALADGGDVRTARSCDAIAGASLGGRRGQMFWGVDASLDRVVNLEPTAVSSQPAGPSST